MILFFFNLENDNNLIIPFNYQIQIIISSMRPFDLFWKKSSIANING